MSVWDWAKTYPHPAVAILAVIGGFLLWLARFAFTRHREFVAFVAHMDREERNVWPALTRQLGENHEQAMALLHEHGERIAALEARMPNGEIREIQRMVTAMYERRTTPRGGE